MKKFSFTIFCLSSLLFCSDAFSAESDVVSNMAAEYNHHIYQLFNLNMTWEEAEAYFESMGGHLATITSQTENDFLYDYIVSLGYTSAFFGATDKETEGVWKWVDGQEFTYSNWHKNEPNNQNNREHYAMFYYKYLDGTWNDGEIAASEEIPFLCEWDGTSYSVALTSGEPLTTENVLDDSESVILTDWDRIDTDDTPASDTKSSDKEKEKNNLVSVHIDTKGKDENLSSESSFISVNFHINHLSVVDLSLLGIGGGSIIGFLAFLVSKLKKKPSAKRKVKSSSKSSTPSSKRYKRYR